ncbi:MAG: SpoVR family protein [Deltaproteobacteria bacterium CG_4_10_14_0_2_um_filter_43_8]|nr:MAG: SpoVR family protein [Deltaproteobacteria bacterium CG11_big_fil_rev_8_21_14_0_20_42_23]PJA20267.1 MAG: SpoVR family protein [Deltaproteobacteria bacterium CG_4_10_14_0_2_um_filter_43_8]PJC64049.1 MAG: SpoVR family protein [Deltaproteobacteria bacterium CG_4_9_14_0_2_um_filter_42_21]
MTHAVYKKYDTSLSPELLAIKKKVKLCAEEFGLDFFEVIFEVLDWRQINEVAAFGGFPNRYPHWRFGMEYEQLSKSYAYGLSKIYEMVINNNPCYAYLLHSNQLVDQKLVMAHVYGHCDFFKNNIYFAHTNRKMMDEMANHRTKVIRHIERYGRETVEDFIDACLSIDTLIDYNAPAIRRKSIEHHQDASGIIHRLHTDKPYLDKFINPPEFLEYQRQQLEDQLEREQKLPLEPEKDIMLFLLEHAPLERWQHDVLSIIREEAYYFAPQMQTKIINEGWACYVHTRLMTEKLLTDDEVIDYADHHSGTVAMQKGGPINPYKIGLELFRDIEDRWNKGKFGKEYEDCTNMVEREKWDKKLGLGREKIFEVRKIYNDINFLETFLTPEFCAQHKLFVYALNPTADQYEIVTREFKKVKQQILFQMTNFGRPIIHVVDARYQGRDELLLKHSHEGMDLRDDYRKEVMQNLFRFWRRPVHLETIAEGTAKILSFDGHNHSEKRL